MNLSYAPSLDAPTRVRLEETARATGLPLAELELLGQDPLVAQGFIASVANGDHDAYLARVDWEDLRANLDLTATHEQRVGAAAT